MLIGLISILCGLVALAILGVAIVHQAGKHVL